MTAIAPPIDVPPDPFRVECLIAAVGIGPFVDATIQRVHGYQLDRAAKVPDEINRRIYRFLNRDEPEPTAELPDFDFDEVVAMLDDETLPEHVLAQIAALGDDGDTALAVNLQVQRIVAYLKGKIPRRVHQSLAGPEYTRPPESDIARFARMWAIAQNPLSILDDLNEYAVSRDQAQAIADIYPQLFATFFPSVQAQLARAKQVDKSFHLLRQKETLLRVLTKQEAQNVTLGRALQAQFAADAAVAAPTPRGLGKKGADTESTAAQRIDQ